VDGKFQLQVAIAEGDLNISMVKLLVRGGASIEGIEGQMSSALNQAAFRGNFLIVEWLLSEGGASISDVDRQSGFTALLSAALGLCVPPSYSNLVTIQGLLEHRGANITDTTANGKTVWDFLSTRVLTDANAAQREYARADQVATLDLLRVMVLRDAPPANIVVQMPLQYLRMVEQGTQLRAGLLAYLTRRRALLAEHTSLITPLWAIIN
jgi:hypothetical protein